MIFWLKHLFEMSTIISRVAAGANVEKAQAKKVLETLREILKKELQEKDKIFTLGLLSASVRIVPEKPAKAKLCFGKMCNLASKPTRRVVRLVPNKKLRELQ